MSDDEKNVRKVFDLEERTARFGEAVISFATRIPKSAITLPLVNQLVRSATSVGANYCEADAAESRKDFEHKIGICKKEAKESVHWLRMVSVAVPNLAPDGLQLQTEARELLYIFIAIVRNSRHSSALEIGN